MENKIKVKDGIGVAAVNGAYTGGPCASPVRWVGGKARSRKRYIGLMPEHRVYVEPYAGGASVLLGKPPCDDIINDLDDGLINLFTVLQGPYYTSLLELIKGMPYSKKSLAKAKTWESESDPVLRAALYCALTRMSFSANQYSYGPDSIDTPTNRNAWRNLPARLVATHARLSRVAIESRDALDCIREQGPNPDAMLYVDPPYIKRKKKSKADSYRHDYTDADHRDLVSTLLSPSLKAGVILCGYADYIYGPLLACGWTRYTRPASVPSKGCVGKLKGAGIRSGENGAIESIYVSPNIREYVAERAPKLGWTLATD